MEKNKTANRAQQTKGANSREPIDTGFPVRFSCGTGPDEEADGFKNAVRGLIKKGYLETDAKKVAEACFKALAKT